jgi:peptidyl-prolyl cis-trans isomerase B (cyclophilin B)
MVIIEMTDGKQIKIELLGEHAPNTVANFKSLVAKGFYDGLIFHRVISGFMIQGGCPSGSGTGGPGYGIKGEFAVNGVNNTLSHKRGVVSMARAAGHNTAGSQFFIVHEDATFLDKQYAAFGRVVEGMDVVDAIAATPTNASDRPDTPQVMKSVTLTEDETVEEPEKM